MKIYRVTYREADGEHHGFSYHATQREVNAIDNSDEMIAEVKVFDVPLTKGAILAFLNNHCGYPDNG